MYSNSLLQIIYENRLGDEITVKTGVKQGCVLSPTLFNVFLNHLPSLQFETYNSVSLYKKVSLLYADDLLLLNCAEKGMQAF